MKIKRLISLMLSGILAFSLAIPSFADNLNDALTDEMLADNEKLDLENGTYDGNVYNETSNQNGKANSVIVVDIKEATNFKVIVPIALHVSMDGDGNITHRDSMESGKSGTAKIINESSLGAVIVSDVSLVKATDWTISDFDADYANMKVNTKTFGFKINGLSASPDGTILTANTASDYVDSVLEDGAEYDGAATLTASYDDFDEISFSGNSSFPVIHNHCVLPIYYEAKLPAFRSAFDAPVGAVVFTVDFDKVSGDSTGSEDPSDNPKEDPQDPEEEPTEVHCITKEEAGAMGFLFGSYADGLEITGFENKQNLTEITIPHCVDNVPVYSIGNTAFGYTTDFTSVTIPDGVICIDDYAFRGCTGLTCNLTIPNTVTTIGDFAFGGCKNLTGDLVIPSSVTSIGISAFQNCKGLTSITIPNSVTEIGSGAFSMVETVYYNGDLESSEWGAGQVLSYDET